jgi:DNA helicase-2/ATP-dependent DNA helicase PcrA
MYVAVTRARKRLYLSFAQTRMLHGQTRYNLPSRFFDEIPGGTREMADAARRRRRLCRQESAGLLPRRAAAWALRRRRRVRSESSGGGGFRIGQSVMHAKFGLGVIINAEGSGSDARVQVNFGAPASSGWRCRWPNWRRLMKAMNAPTASTSITRSKAAAPGSRCRIP